MPARFSAFPHFSTLGLHRKNCFADIVKVGYVKLSAVAFVRQ